VNANVLVNATASKEESSCKELSLESLYLSHSWWGL
jgi:hypothetical protein